MNGPRLSGWEKLKCPFFGNVCQRVLGYYLESNGFAEQGPNEIGGLMYSRFGTFLEISYELDTAPNYSPTVILGTGDKKYDESGRPCGVPFWFVIPSDVTARGYSLWQFKTETELEAVFIRIREEVLEPHAKSLWENLELLGRVIRNFRSEFGA